MKQNLFVKILSICFLWHQLESRTTSSSDKEDFGHSKEKFGQSVEKEDMEWIDDLSYPIEDREILRKGK